MSNNLLSLAVLAIGVCWSGCNSQEPEKPLALDGHWVCRDFKWIEHIASYEEIHLVVHGDGFDSWMVDKDGVKSVVRSGRIQQRDRQLIFEDKDGNNSSTWAIESRQRDVLKIKPISNPSPNDDVLVYTRFEDMVGGH
ncbi:MAG: hypothetical protein V1809_03455 [Planctomycetota bacterium]